MTDTPSLLTVQNLTVKYDAVVALDAISLEVRQGESIALIGANGAGKSTLLRAISGLIRSTSGDIHYDGQSIRQSSPQAILRGGIAPLPRRTPTVRQSDSRGKPAIGGLHP